MSVRHAALGLRATATEKILDSFLLESAEKERRRSTVLGASAAGLEEGFSCSRQQELVPQQPFLRVAPQRRSVFFFFFSQSQRSDFSERERK